MIRDCEYRQAIEGVPLIRCGLAEAVCGGERVANPYNACSRCYAERGGQEPCPDNLPPAVRILCGTMPPLGGRTLGVVAPVRRLQCFHLGEKLESETGCTPCRQKYKCELPQVTGPVRPGIECQVCELYEADTPEG